MGGVLLFIPSLYPSDRPTKPRLGRILAYEIPKEVDELTGLPVESFEVIRVTGKERTRTLPREDLIGEPEPLPPGHRAFRTCYINGDLPWGESRTELLSPVVDSRILKKRNHHGSPLSFWNP